MFKLLVVMVTGTNVTIIIHHCAVTALRSRILRKEMLTLWGMLLTTYFHVVVMLHSALRHTTLFIAITHNPCSVRMTQMPKQEPSSQNSPSHEAAQPETLNQDTQETPAISEASAASEDTAGQKKQKPGLIFMAHGLRTHWIMVTPRCWIFTTITFPSTPTNPQPISSAARKPTVN